MRERLLLGALVILLLAGVATAQQDPDRDPRAGAPTVETRADEDPSPAFGSFGLGTQDYWVESVAFVPGSAAGVWTYQLFAYFANTGTGLDNFRAPIQLPAGAHVSLLECSFDDTSASNITVTLFKNRHDISSNVRNNTSMGSVSSSGTGGLQQPSTATNFTIRFRENNERIFYYLSAAMPADANAQLRGCRLEWNRQITPTPVTATFNDVLVGHPQHQFIEALVSAGITAGCQVSPPLYCPDANLTRGQMAVFLARALGLHWPN
jgi:hypothetical protein